MCSFYHRKGRAIRRGSKGRVSSDVPPIEPSGIANHIDLLVFAAASDPRMIEDTLVKYQMPVTVRGYP